MKKVIKFSTLFYFLFGHTHTSLALTNTSSKAPQTELNQSVGLLEVFPFQNKKRALRCTAFHIGNGYVLSAGHCFLGAWDCNHARVWFGNAQSSNTRAPSQCLKVIKNSIRTKNYFSEEDYVLLRVDNPPQEFLPILHSKPIQYKEIKVYSYNDMFQQTQSSCSFLKQANDIFGRQRTSENTFAFNCPLGRFSHGAPIVYQGTVIGTLNSSLYSPRLKNQEHISLANYLPSFVSQENLAIGYEDQAPQEINLGSFLPEAFPFGLPDKLNLHVYSQRASSPSSFNEKIKFTVSPTSKFLVLKNGKTIKEIFGLQDDTSLAGIDIESPYEIFLQTAKDIFSINEKIEYYSKTSP